MQKKRQVDLFGGIPADILKKRKKRAQPSFISPMLATLTEDYFSSNAWISEHKFDGVRCLAFKKDGNVRLVSRNNKSMNTEYPELVTALEKQTADNFILDGEVISVGKKGISDFQQLQGRMHLLESETIAIRQKEVPVKYCIFDLVYADGYDLCNLPLLVRKKILKRLLRYTRLLFYSIHKVGNQREHFKAACRQNWEGLIVKRADSSYVDKRSTDWLKFKCVMDQELVIGGYTESRNSRSYFGALLVGYYKNNELKYAGKVGTGFSEAVLHELGKKLRALEIKTCPFVNYDISSKGVHWVKPILVGQFGFAQWTKEGKLRVGRYRGLREDKLAKEVIRERPRSVASSYHKAGKNISKKKRAA